MKYLVVIVTIFSLGILFACDDMYSIHQQYLDEGEQIYLGKPVVQMIQGGNERVQIVWTLNADPKIRTCCIYWNNRADSLEVSPDYTNTVMRQIIPLKEGLYVFELMTKGDNGLISLTSIASGKSYGMSYKETLYNVLLTNQSKTDDGLVMTWGTEEGCVFTELKYLNNSGKEKNVRLEGNETTLVLNDYVPGGDFTWRSYYLPEKFSIDTIPANSQTLKFIE